MGSKSTAVAKNASGQITAVPEDLLASLIESAGQGFEGASQEDYALPFVKLLQALSPQLSKNDAAFIPEARPGDIVISTSGALFAGEDGIRVIPVTFSKKYLEYRKRTNGGGFVASYDTKDDGLNSMQDGNELVDTANHFVLFEDSEGNLKPACLSMSSSKLKVSRKWLSVMADVIIQTPKGAKGAASFAKTYRVTSVEETNRRNEKYFSYAINAEGWTSKPAFEAAKGMRDRLEAGELRTDFAQGSDTVVEETTSPSGKAF